MTPNTKLVVRKRTGHEMRPNKYVKAIAIICFVALTAALLITAFKTHDPTPLQGVPG